MLVCAYFLRLQRMNELVLQGVCQEDLITAWSQPSPAMHSAAHILQGKYRQAKGEPGSIVGNALNSELNNAWIQLAFCLRCSSWYLDHLTNTRCVALCDFNGSRDARTDGRFQYRSRYKFRAVIFEDCGLPKTKRPEQVNHDLSCLSGISTGCTSPRHEQPGQLNLAHGCTSVIVSDP